MSDSGRDLLRAAVNALHEAFGTPTTRCENVNRVLREYPDADPEAIERLLRYHDEGYCNCAREATPNGG